MICLLFPSKWNQMFDFRLEATKKVKSPPLWNLLDKHRNIHEDFKVSDHVCSFRTNYYFGFNVYNIYFKVFRKFFIKNKLYLGSSRDRPIFTVIWTWRLAWKSDSVKPKLVLIPRETNAHDIQVERRFNASHELWIYKYLWFCCYINRFERFKKIRFRFKIKVPMPVSFWQMHIAQETPVMVIHVG